MCRLDNPAVVITVRSLTLSGGQEGGVVAVHSTLSHVSHFCLHCLLLLEIQRQYNSQGLKQEFQKIQDEILIF